MHYSNFAVTVLFVNIALFSIISCSKSSDQSDIGNIDTTTIVGQWQEIQRYISPGTVVDWENIKNGGLLTINADSTYKSTSSMFFNQENNSGIFTFINGYYWRAGSFGAFISPAGDTLALGLVHKKDTLELWHPLAIEGLAVRYLKVK